MRLINLNLDYRFFRRQLFSPFNLITRLRILKRKISQFEPSIVTFQEVTDVFALSHLKASFFRFNFVYQGLLKIEGGVVTLYDKSKWRLVSKQFMAFTEQGKLFSQQLIDRILRKGVLAVILESRKTGRKLLVINVHLTANYGQKVTKEEEKIFKIQLKEIQGLIKKYQKICRWQLIAGDFNISFNHELVREWIKAGGFLVALPPESCTVCPGTNPLCHRSQQKNYQIDNVLCLNCQKISGQLIFNQEGEFISDHYGQLVEVKF
jgi:endonuclease/exonuclease/phosphatase family metal-dependent hydrolase